MKIRPVGAELLHADRQTDRHDEANIRFSHKNKSANTKIHDTYKAHFAKLLFRTDEKKT